MDLDQLIAAMGQARNFWTGLPKSRLLVRARFADACRNAGVRPVVAGVFSENWEPLDAEAQLRLALFVSAMELEAVGRRIPLFADEGTGAAALGRLCQLSGRLELLTSEVLENSDIRLEEIARHFCAEWGLSIQGERKAHSGNRLREIDFSRLMAEARAARDSAEDRMAYLRELQERELGTRRARRGKW